MEQVKQLSNEQLMELLETKKDEKVDVIYLQEDDLSGFLSFYNISPGSDKIKINELYKLYKNWSKQPMNFKEFKKCSNKIFQLDKSTIFINQNKAIINQFLIEKLNSLEKYNTTKSKIVRVKIEDFLNHYQIKDGDVWTKGLELYKLFTKYYRTIGPEKFYKLLHLYVTTSEIINNERHFKIAPYEKTKEVQKRQD